MLTKKARARFQREIDAHRRTGPRQVWLGIILITLVGAAGFFGGIAVRSVWPILFGGLMLLYGLCAIQALLRPLPPLCHDVLVLQGPPFQAYCTCSWTSEEHDALDAAVEAAELHASPGSVTVEEVTEAEATRCTSALFQKGPCALDRDGEESFPRQTLVYLPGDPKASES